MPISSELQYSASSGFETAENGSGAALNLIPGTNIYFRQSATASSFSSDAYLLTVPERPVVSSTESGSTELHPFMLDITFFQMLVITWALARGPLQPFLPLVWVTAAFTFISGTRYLIDGVRQFEKEHDTES